MKNWDLMKIGIDSRSLVYTNEISFSTFQELIKFLDHESTYVVGKGSHIFHKNEFVGTTDDLYNYQIELSIEQEHMIVKGFMEFLGNKLDENNTNQEVK